MPNGSPLVLHGIPSFAEIILHRKLISSFELGGKNPEASAMNSISRTIGVAFARNTSHRQPLAVQPSMYVRIVREAAFGDKHLGTFGSASSANVQHRLFTIFSPISLQPRLPITSCKTAIQ